MKTSSKIFALLLLATLTNTVYPAAIRRLVKVVALAAVAVARPDAAALVALERPALPAPSDFSCPILPSALAMAPSCPTWTAQNNHKPVLPYRPGDPRNTKWLAEQYQLWDPCRTTTKPLTETTRCCPVK